MSDMSYSALDIIGEDSCESSRSPSPVSEVLARPARTSNNMQLRRSRSMVTGPPMGFGRRASLANRDIGEGTLVSKLDLLTDDPNDDEEDLRNKYSEIKRKMSAPTGLTKTLYNLYLNRSRRSRNSVYQIDPSLLERPGRIREIHSMEEFQERLEQAKESLVCVTFSAKWCGPWRMIKPDVHRLSHIHGDVEFYEVDVDENEEIAEARRVACMPTFQFFKRGIMLDKFAEPNRIKLDETIRKLRKMEIRPEE